MAKNRRRLVPVVASAAVGAAGGMLGLAWYLSERITPTKRRSFADFYTFTPWELDVPHEAVTLHTSDGVALSAWWLPRPDAHGVVITCHGHTGSKDDMLGIGTRSWRSGYNVLLFDFRGRGESDPWPNSLISREVDDLLTAVAYARERVPGARIGVVGFSMGAAVAIVAAAREPAIAALVADSSFTAVRDVVAASLRQVLHVPPLPFVTLADLLIQRRHGYSFSLVRPIDEVAKIAPRSLLLIHGEHDSVTPVAHAHELFAAAREPKELWIYPGVDHCGAYFADRQGYTKRVIAFFDLVLKVEEQRGVRN